MNRDASDFMIQEYNQIAAAFFGLSNQVNDWFKTYVTLVGLPLTLLAAAIRFGGESGNRLVSLDSLPDVVSGLLVLVALLGLFVVLSIVNMRMEMILYARTINAVRRYFGEQGRLPARGKNAGKLADFLILPTSDSKPPFFEPWKALFWQVSAVGLVDGIVLAVAVLSLFGLSWCASMLVGVGYVSLHVIVYRLIAGQRERDWTLRFREDLSPSNF